MGSIIPYIYIYTHTKQPDFFHCSRRCSFFQDSRPSASDPHSDQPLLDHRSSTSKLIVSWWWWRKKTGSFPGAIWYCIHASILVRVYAQQIHGGCFLNLILWRWFDWRFTFPQVEDGRCWTWWKVISKTNAPASYAFRICYEEHWHHIVLI